MSLEEVRGFSIVPIFLFLASASMFGVYAADYSSSIGEVTKVADIAREKDVVWLALVTAITAMMFSAFVVWQLVRLTEKTNENVSGLREELARRPCVYKSGGL